MAEFVGAIDQGTRARASWSSTARDADCQPAARAPADPAPPGWSSTTLEIVERTATVVRGALASAKLDASDLAAIGITTSGKQPWSGTRRTAGRGATPIVWQDTRTDQLMRELEASGHADRIRAVSGLPPATYFSAGKIAGSSTMSRASGSRRPRPGGVRTIDSWLLWNLTGAPTAACTRPTSPTPADDADVPEVAAVGRRPARRARHPARHAPRHPAVGVGVRRDQRAWALRRPGTDPCHSRRPAVRHRWADLLPPGEAKNTYGTGNFMLMNTGQDIVPSKAGC